VTSFDSLGLAEPLRRSLAAADYTIPTPIQAQAIPHLIEGRDMLGIAQTGTGKTAAFLLPLLQRLAADATRAPARSARALILTPTRELAVQIGDSAKVYGKHMNLRHAVIFGGVGQNPQVQAVARGIDIVIATPGRLLDLMEQGHMRFDTLSALILDEADRMLDMGFIRDIRKIIATVPVKRQTMLFSATMPDAIADLARGILRDPVRVEVTPQSTTVERIDQRVLFVERGDKRQLLAAVLRDPSVASAIVFARTKHGANRVAEQLEKDGHTAAAIHGNKSQGARQRALDDFRAGRVKALVATDIAARGIDIDGVSHVINFDVPVDAESYVHRIGRTARAGAEGHALTFCAGDERGELRAIEKLIRRAIPVADIQPFGLTLGQRAQPEEREARPQSRGHRSQGGRPQGQRAHADRPRGDRPHGDRPRGDRPQGDRPQGDRPQGDRPRNDRPRGDRPHGERRDQAPAGIAFSTRPVMEPSHGDRPQADRHHGERHQARPQGDRPRGDRPQGNRPQGERQQQGQQGNRPRHQGGGQNRGRRAGGRG
jgi:ATP-dependent RNA helicase RhlE